MDQRLDFITLATPDLDAARAFYRDGLEWQPLLDVPGEILFFQVGHGLVLGLYAAVAFEGDLVDADAADAFDGSATSGVPAAAPAPSLRAQGLTLSHNVGSPAEVDAVVERMRVAGGSIRKSPQPAAFGGYHGHVADPNGVLWEVAHNPGWSVGPDGAVSLEAVEE